MAYLNGLSTRPDTVAEVGPGDSLGIGLSALISGVRKYYAFDIEEHASVEKNILIFNELVDLFRNHVHIPDESEFPRVKPQIESYEFPDQILTFERLNTALNHDRIESISNAVKDPGNGEEYGVWISYYVPWYDTNIIEEESVDMIYSQAVLEHVENLSYTYELLYRWLKPGGFMSHVIDFKCHGTAEKWNGHWGISDITWRLIKGARPYLLNRHSHSVHIELLEKLGFDIVCDKRTEDTSGIRRKSLSPRFKDLSDEDLVTDTAFIQAVKK